MYVVNFISSDIRQDEMIHEIADSIEKLENNIKNIFENISKKLSYFNARVENIGKRSELVRLKIDKVKEAGHKTTKVFSNFKYPGSLNINEYLPLYAIPSEKQPSIKSKINSPHIVFNEELLKDKIKFFRVRNDQQYSNAFDLTNIGPIPWKRISSVGSLVLFNSSKNPYVKSSQGMTITDSKIKNRKTPQSSILK